MAEVGPDYFDSADKRTLDIVGGSLVALGATLPAIATAAAVALEHGPDNILFHQRRRANRDGHFIVTKFTTFRDSIDDIAESELPLLLKEYFAEGVSNPAWLAQDHGSTPARDLAVAEQHGLVSEYSTRIGNMMRIAGLDELPQAFSILRGATSLTGPRAQTDSVLESRLKIAPNLFDAWFTGFYEKFKKGWVSPGANWFHRFVPAQTMSPDEVIVNVMEKDLEWVPNANLAYDLRLLAEAPVSVAHGLRHHLLKRRADNKAE